MKERLRKYAEEFGKLSDGTGFPREYTKQEFAEAISREELRNLVSGLPENAILRITFV